jgi:hypothetical protein
LLTCNGITREGVMTLERGREGLYAVNSRELLERRGLALLLRVWDCTFESTILGLNKKRPTSCYVC